MISYGKAEAARLVSHVADYENVGHGILFGGVTGTPWLALLALRALLNINAHSSPT